MSLKTTKLNNFLQWVQGITKKDLIFIVIILALLFIIGFMSWSSDKEQTEDIPSSISVKIPAIRGVSDTVYFPEEVVRDNTVYMENPYDKELELKYLNAKDSITKLNVYLEAITERNYEQIFDDKTQRITVNSKVRGALLKQSLSYNVYPREVKVDTVFKVIVKRERQLYALMELGAPVQIKQNQFVGKASLIFKNKKNQIFSTSIDTDVNVWIGAGIKL